MGYDTVMQGWFMLLKSIVFSNLWFPRREVTWWRGGGGRHSNWTHRLLWLPPFLIFISPVVEFLLPCVTLLTLWSVSYVVCCIWLILNPPPTSLVSFSILVSLSGAGLPSVSPVSTLRSNYHLPLAFQSPLYTWLCPFLAWWLITYYSPLSPPLEDFKDSTKFMISPPGLPHQTWCLVFQPVTIATE